MNSSFKEILETIKGNRPGKIWVILNVNGLRKAFPSFEDIEDGLRGLTKSPNSFLVYKRYPIIHGCAYIQAALPAVEYDDNKGYVVEARLLKNGNFHQYRLRTHSIEEVIAVFSDFYICEQIPDVSCWQEIPCLMEVEPI